MTLQYKFFHYDNLTSSGFYSAGFYGLECAERCSCENALDTAVCEATNGRCGPCRAGWTGPTCQTQCPCEYVYKSQSKKHLVHLRLRLELRFGCIMWWRQFIQPSWRYNLMGDIEILFTAIGVLTAICGNFDLTLTYRALRGSQLNYARICVSLLRTNIICT